MPNYCSNYLQIEGKENTIKELLQLVKSDKSVFDFEKIIPMPVDVYKGLLGADEKEIYDESNWYDWSWENWGTKWNSIYACVNDDEIVFETAWSPCVPVIDELAKMFPTLRIVYIYDETNMGFCGKRIYENGKLIFCYDGDYCDDCLCEENDTLIDPWLFPAKESGHMTAIDITEQTEQGMHGTLFYRVYENNKIASISTGTFMAAKEFSFKFPGPEIVSVNQAV